MKTTDFLDAVKAAYNLPSDYALAKKLSVTTSCITNYRANRNFMDDSMALKVAYLLDVEPLQVIACAQIERANRANALELVEFWQEVIKSSKNPLLTFDKMTNVIAA